MDQEPLSHNPARRSQAEESAADLGDLSASPRETQGWLGTLTPEIAAVLIALDIRSDTELYNWSGTQLLGATIAEKIAEMGNTLAARSPEPIELGSAFRFLQEAPFANRPEDVRRTQALFRDNPGFITLLTQCFDGSMTHWLGSELMAALIVAAGPEVSPYKVVCDIYKKVTALALNSEPSQGSVRHPVTLETCSSGESWDRAAWWFFAYHNQVMRWRPDPVVFGGGRGINDTAPGTLTPQDFENALNCKGS